MMVFKVTISDIKGGKCYQKELSGDESKGLIGKRIGETFRGEVLGLTGYELMITGGSDRQGFAMRKDVEGAARKKVLLAGPPGYRPTSDGIRRRKSVRGNTISDAILQINTKVVKAGKKKLEISFAGDDGGAEKAE
ncbi:MAG: 30S ribosomal protein S6e [Methanopyri archaeon]|nr:30S ribosomal protein S6e [Methanopyri archaeon]